MSQDMHESLRQFVYFETQLLDEQRYEDWYALFAEDGVYWVPTSHTQTDRDTQPSIALETRMLLKLRIQRMQHAQAHSLRPEVRGMHVIQRPEVLHPENLADGMHAVACNMLYMEHQGDRQTTLGGRARYLLRQQSPQEPQKPQWLIVEKRVTLLGCEGFLPAIQLFI